MRSILEAIYNGRISPRERSVSMTEAQQELERKITAEKQYFRENLSPEDSQRLERLESLYSSAGHYEDEDLFIHSFWLGAMLMQEILERKEIILGNA